LKSMTGFGRATATLPDGTELSVIVRGVNHRFLDLAIKMRDEFAPLEPALRRLVGEFVLRGHVDLLIRSQRPAGKTATFDAEAAARYAGLWKETATAMGLPSELTARDLLSLPGVVRTDEPAEADEAVRQALIATVRRALEDFDATRYKEGEAVKGALEAILTRLEEGVARLDRECDQVAARLAETLRERVKKLAEGVPLDEGRLAQEVALLADRADISEEIDRQKAHLAEVRSRIGEEGSIGKRLDFLAQELHRETNTAGQKSRELPALRAVLDLKSDVEALKEQVQNVE
jgi:uncharacterized protein (TIGR00255 family)